MSTHTARPVWLSLAGAAALVAVAACTNDDQSTPSDTEAPPATEQPGGDTSPDGDDTGDDASGESSPDATDPGSTAADADIPPEYDGVLATIDLAVSEHDGAPAFEVDDGDGGIWEVHVAVGQDDIEVHVSADGTEVLSSSRESDLDSDDRAGLEAAGDHTLADAVRAAIAEYGGTNPIDDVSISEENGSYAWEVGFTDDVEVYLDIATGEVLRVEQD